MTQEDEPMSGEPVQGGNVYLECKSCLAIWEDDVKSEFCPFCGSTDVRETEPPDAEAQSDSEQKQ